MALSSEDWAANDLLAIMTGNVGGQRGITAAADGTTASTLDITIAGSGQVYALLGDGNFIPPAQLQAVTAANLKLAGNTVNGTYKLWLDLAGDGITPVFSVAAAGTPPSARAVAVGTVTVAANVISAYVAITFPAL